jgi:MFS family permease
MGARVERDGQEVVETDVPQRMDRLPWSRWHWLVVIALGVTWVLDGLEVTIVGAIASVLQRPDTLSLSATDIGLAGSIYIVGAVVGAFTFGYLTDRLGRKRLFMWTLLLYLVATVATAFSWAAIPFFVFRFFTGMGIGGEYAAINSATEELNPARVRGRVELAINGSWWAGTAAGAALTLIVLNPAWFSPDVGWRLAFGLGAVLGLGVLLIRKLLPESPRWLMTHNREEEAEEVVSDIERQVKEYTGRSELPEPEGDPIEIHPRDHTPPREIFRTMFRDDRKRTLLGLTLMAAQAFVYNAVFFTFGLVLTTFFKVPDQSVGLYILPFAVGNFLGPFLLGPLFDSIGRRTMIAFSYIASGVLLAVTGWMFSQGILFTSGWSITIAWSIIFFFASAGASAGYLTVSEIFPLEIRANAIAFFFAIGTGIGGIIGPLLFGKLIETGKESMVAVGYWIGAGAMILAGLVEAMIGVDAEQRPLEEVAQPLSAETDTASVSEGGRQEADSGSREDRRAG